MIAKYYELFMLRFVIPIQEAVSTRGGLMKKCEDSLGFSSQEGPGIWLFVMFTVGVMCGLGFATMLVK